jgi:hypothetical protein
MPQRLGHLLQNRLVDTAVAAEYDFPGDATH